MRLSFGGTLTIRAPEGDESWVADLGVIAAEGQRPSAAVFLTASECRYIAQWLTTMADVDDLSELAGELPGDTFKDIFA